MTSSYLGIADPEKMKLLSALTRDPNLIHLEGDRPVNQGPIAMTWLMEQARHMAGPDEALVRFKIRFVGKIYAGDEVSYAVERDVSRREVRLRATVDDNVVADATATFGRSEDAPVAT
jgi:hypothetical protein